MTKPDKQKLIAILGGVGPLASSRFLNNIYSQQIKSVAKEQELPRVLLYSNPMIPDRTESLESGKETQLFHYLLTALEQLLSLGADKIIICCFTLHYFLEYLPAQYRQKISSLPQIALLETLALKKPVLLLTSRATNNLHVFEKDFHWPQAREYIIKPDKDDQNLVHDYIYLLKANQGHSRAKQFILSLMDKYKADNWIAGCTEFHLLDFDQAIDPLMHIAKHLQSITTSDQSNESTMTQELS